MSDVVHEVNIIESLENVVVPSYYNSRGVVSLFLVPSTFNVLNGYQSKSESKFTYLWLGF